MKRSCFYFLGFLSALTVAVYAKLSESHPLQTEVPDDLAEVVLNETRADTLAGERRMETVADYPNKKISP